MPGDLGVVSITCASGSRWADFSMGCRISALAPTTLATVRKKPAECWPRQIPIQDRRCRSPAFLGTHSIMPLKKKKCLVTVETVRGIFPVPLPFPLLHQSITPWKWIIQKWREKESSEWVPDYPSCAGHVRRNPFLSSSTQSTEAGPPKLGKRREQERDR